MALRTVRHAVTTPGAAVEFARSGDVSGDDRIPAILWLSIGLIGLWSLRHGLPSGRQAATGAAAIGAIVLAGSVAPRLVTWVLLALVITAAIGAGPQITALLKQLQQGVTLSVTGGQTHG